MGTENSSRFVSPNLLINFTEKKANVLKNHVRLFLKKFEEGNREL